jgi:segregation and condensation protein B
VNTTAELPPGLDGPETDPSAAQLPVPGEDTAEAAEVQELERHEQQGLLTALLFASGEVLAAERLGVYFGLAPQDLDLLVEETAAGLRQLGLDILKAAGGYRLVTAAQWDEALRGFFRQVRKSRLSRNSLEILAVIAYEQPVTRVKIDELRQANSESAVRTLLERRLITVAGREDTPGKPFIYKTTDAFLELFGLASLADLPPKPVNFDVLRAAGGAGEDDDEFAGPGPDQA